MRLLLGFLIATALTACGEDRCNDAPLSGTTACANLDGAWLIVGNDDHPRCGARLFANAALIISSSGNELRASLAGNPMLGVNHVSGAFELDSLDGQFSLSGEAVRTHPPELRGGVVFGGSGQTCNALWDFAGYRQ